MNVRIQSIFSVAGLLLLWLTPAFAHHSGAMFDMKHLVSVTGVVTRVEWTNPHTFMYLHVKTAEGQVQEWAIEFNSPNFLKHNGWTSATVNAGDTITCTGAPARDGSRVMHSMVVELTSGLKLRS
jgi:hypothetical protein